jgi:hypothetical protein
VRFLLDESLPRGLKGLLEGHDVVTVFVTADQNLEHQQNIASLPFAVVVLVGTSNRMEAYVPLAKKLGEAVRVAASWNGHKSGRLTMHCSGRARLRMEPCR